MSSIARMLVIACTCTAIFSGCGQRGPLYLPDETTTESAAAKDATDAKPAEEDDAER